MTSKYVKDFEATNPFPYPIRGNPFESVFNPTGLVPFPCSHGLAELPKGHPQVHREPQYGTGGGELPRFGGGRSWGKQKYLTIVYFGGRTEKLPGGQEVTVASAIVKCPVCIGLPAPDDLTEWTDGR